MQPYINELVKKQLPNLQNFTLKVIRNKGWFNIEPNDIIHTAFVILHDRKLEFGYQNMLSPIYEALAVHRFPQRRSKVSFLNRCEYNTCKKCKDPLPLGMFHKMRVDKSGAVTYQVNCMACQSEIDESNRVKRLQSPAEKAAYNLKRKLHMREKAKIIKSNPLLAAHYKAKAQEADKKFKDKKRKQKSSI